MIYRQKTGLSVIAIFCTLLLMAGLGICADPNSRDTKPAADINDPNGPTVMLSYNTLKPVKTPTSSFMYFIPLISPTLVSTQISPNNQQQAMFISYEKTVVLDSFTVSCEFELQGNGFFRDIFDSNGVIATFPEEIKKNAPVSNLLDYIRLEGEGFGRIDVKGTIADSNATVTQVDVHFNTKGKKSPVTIGLYSIKPENGHYKYENRHNEIVARVATLTFKKCDGEPRMDIEVVSVNKASRPNSYIGRVKGFIVNFFIEPIRISKLGNDTMLNFGYALLNKQTSFTFPKAINIKSQTVAP
ncbi:MAG: hypothetical protein ABSF37_00250 [Sedimentisphaerales bacterium]